MSDLLSSYAPYALAAVVGATTLYWATSSRGEIDESMINARPSSPSKLKREMSSAATKFAETGKADWIDMPSKFYPAYASSLPAQTGKVFAITGTSSGTGYQLAQTLVEKGAQVVLLNRQSKKADIAAGKLAELAAGVSAPPPLSVECNLTSFASVRAAGERLKTMCAASGIDVLVNNAGVMAFADEATADGLDVQMQTNHTSHFLLTKLCMPLLEKAAELRGEARVVNHSSALRAMTEKGWDNHLKKAHLGKNGGNLGGNGQGICKGPDFQRVRRAAAAPRPLYAPRLCALCDATEALVRAPIDRARANRPCARQSTVRAPTDRARANRPCVRFSVGGVAVSADEACKRRLHVRARRSARRQGFADQGDRRASGRRSDVAARQLDGRRQRDAARALLVSALLCEDRADAVDGGRHDGHPPLRLRRGGAQLRLLRSSG